MGCALPPASPLLSPRAAASPVHSCTACCALPRRPRPPACGPGAVVSAAAVPVCPPARLPALLLCSCARLCGTTLPSGAPWRACTWCRPRRLPLSGGLGKGTWPCCRPCKGQRPAPAPEARTNTPAGGILTVWIVWLAGRSCAWRCPRRSRLQSCTSTAGCTGCTGCLLPTLVLHLPDKLARACPAPGAHPPSGTSGAAARSLPRRPCTSRRCAAATPQVGQHRAVGGCGGGVLGGCGWGHARTWGLQSGHGQGSQWVGGRAAHHRSSCCPSLPQRCWMCAGRTTTPTRGQWRGCNMNGKWHSEVHTPRWGSPPTSPWGHAWAAHTPAGCAAEQPPLHAAAHKGRHVQRASLPDAGREHHLLGRGGLLVAPCRRSGPPPSRSAGRE